MDRCPFGVRTLKTSQLPLKEGAVSDSVAQVGKGRLGQIKESEALGTSVMLGFEGTSSTDSSKF